MGNEIRMILEIKENKNDVKIINLYNDSKSNVELYINNKNMKLVIMAILI